MKDNARRGLAWLGSLVAHALLLFLAVPGGWEAGGQDLRLVEVGLLELPGPQAAEPSPVLAAPAGRRAEQAPSGRSRNGESAGPGATERDNGEAKPQKSGEEAGEAGRESAPAPAGSRTGAEGQPGAAGDPGWGTGEGFVLSRPVSYPKNAQNDGVEGAVRLAIRLPAAGSPQAVLLESSGDRRLDDYSLQVVTKVWRYEPPGEGVLLTVRLVFQDDRVEVVFERAEPWAGEGE